MHEVNNPLEALTNLVYLTKQSANDPEAVLKSMQLIESQLIRLAEITRKTLSFYREQTEAREFDLVEIAESALKIHAHRARKQNIDVRMKADGPAYATVFASEILQVLSNLIINSYDALPESGGTLVPAGKKPGGPGPHNYCRQRQRHRPLCVQQFVSGTQHLEGQRHRAGIMAVARHR